MKQYPEDRFQIAAARYLDVMGAIWFHPANERKTSRMRGGKLKKMGVKPGIPDILIFNARHGFHGLAIELKIRPNKPTDTQSAWLAKLAAANWKTALVYDFDEFLTLVDDYFKP